MKEKKGRMLLPALSKARERARISVCANNLKKIGLALLMYAEDYEYLLPWYSGPSGSIQRPIWSMLISPYLGLTLNRWYGTKTVFYCPSDRSGIASWVITNSHFGKNSYCVNLEIMDSERGDANVDGWRGGRKLSSIKKPSQTIMVAEHWTPGNCIGWGDYSAKCYNKGYIFEYTVQNGTEANDAGKRGYHNLKNNWLFCDGHVEYISYKDTLSPINLWIYNK